MTAFLAGPAAWLLPVGIVLICLVAGPLPIAVRGMIRGATTVQIMRRWYRPAALGLGLGLVGSVAVVGLVDSELALGAALLCLLFLLAIIDWQWRWLPIEWTLGVIALGVLFALQSGDPLRVFIQMSVPVVVLLLVRQTLLWILQKEALGLGDIWLIAGLGAFLDPFESFLLIGFAALSGLLEVGLRRLRTGHQPAPKGVAYGTHLCIIFVILRNFTSLA